MMRPFLFLISIFALVSAQREPTLDDVEDVAKNALAAANAYLAAAKANKITASTGTSGCVRDYTTGECIGSFLEQPRSFLQQRKASPLIRPLINRMMGSETEA